MDSYLINNNKNERKRMNNNNNNNNKKQPKLELFNNETKTYFYLIYYS